MHRHLAPGGALVFDHGVSYASESCWHRWLRDERRRLPEPWPEAGDRRLAPDGSEYELKGRTVDLDPLEQRLTLGMRASLRRDGALVAEEEYILQTSLYLRNELLLMLETAGFDRVTVHDGYSGAPATADAAALVFVAER
jgi:hypothetical protein